MKYTKKIHSLKKTHIKLNIQTFVIIMITIIQFIKSSPIFCEILQPNFKKYTNNNHIISHHLYQQQKKSDFNDNHQIYQSKYLNNSNNNNIITYPYSKNWSSYHNSPKICLQNDSINIFRMFYNYKDDNYHKYYKVLPFLQLGLQNILLEKIISLGGGTRYIINDLYAIGYNTFFHFPVSSKSMHQPNLMNIQGEYWHKNILFMFNNFININQFLDLKETSLPQKRIQYPKNGYQIHIQTKFPIFSELTGKITLERFSYIKNNKNNLNDTNKNHHLILGIDYYPIPILGFNINKIFTTNKNNNSINYKLLMNYQLNIPISQQINYINNKKFPSIIKNLNTAVQLFIPVIINDIQEDKNDCNNDYKNNTLECCYKEITGHPGEIKIIEITEDEKNEPVQWDIQSLQKFKSFGGNIVLLKKHIYAIYMPYNLINKENQLILSYTTNIMDCSHKYQSKQILISVKNLSEKNILQTQLSYMNYDYNNIIETHHESYKESNINQDNQQTQTLNFNENYSFHNNSQDHVSPIPSSTRMNHDIYHNAKKNHKTIQHPSPSGSLNTNENDSDLLPSTAPSPIILSHFLSEEMILSDEEEIKRKEEFTSSNIIKSLPPTPPPFPLFLLKKDNKNDQDNQHGTQSPSLSPLSSNALKLERRSKSALQNYQYNDEVSFTDIKENTNMASSYITSDDQTHQAIKLLNQNLLHLLSTHKKSKFSSIGTIEHIKKLEDTRIHRKKKYLSDMEQIFSKLHLTQSSSSIDDYRTTDNSNNSLYSSSSSNFFYKEN